VRTTYQAHARLQRKIINHDTGGHIVCMWADCEREAITTYRVLQHRHPHIVNCDLAAHFDPASHIRFAFCSERHLNHFRFDHGPEGHAMLESRGGLFGYLPTGYRGGIL
jgi:hypothetical protein